MDRGQIQLLADVAAERTTRSKDIAKFEAEEQDKSDFKARAKAKTKGKPKCEGGRDAKSSIKKRVAMRVNKLIPLQEEIDTSVDVTFFVLLHEFRKHLGGGARCKACKPRSGTF